MEAAIQLRFACEPGRRELDVCWQCLSMALSSECGQGPWLGRAPAAWKAALWDVFGRWNTLPRCFVWREKKEVSRYGSFSN